MADEISEFKVEPLGVSISKIQTYLEKVYELLEESIAKSNNPPTEVFLKTENDYDRHYLKITHEEALYGIACIGYD